MTSSLALVILLAMLAPKTFGAVARYWCKRFKLGWTEEGP